MSCVSPSWLVDDSSVVDSVDTGAQTGRIPAALWPVGEGVCFPSLLL